MGLRQLEINNGLYCLIIKKYLSKIKLCYKEYIIKRQLFINTHVIYKWQI